MIFSLWIDCLTTLDYSCAQSQWFCIEIFFSFHFFFLSKHHSSVLHHKISLLLHAQIHKNRVHSTIFLMSAIQSWKLLFHRGEPVASFNVITIVDFLAIVLIAFMSFDSSLVLRQPYGCFALLKCISGFSGNIYLGLLMKLSWSSWTGAFCRLDHFVFLTERVSLWLLVYLWLCTPTNNFHLWIGEIRKICSFSLWFWTKKSEGYQPRLVMLGMRLDLYYKTSLCLISMRLIRLVTKTMLKMVVLLTEPVFS